MIETELEVTERIEEMVSDTFYSVEILDKLIFKTHGDLTEIRLQIDSIKREIFIYEKVLEIKKGRKND